MSQQPLAASQLQRDWMVVRLAWMQSLLQRQVSCGPPAGQQRGCVALFADGSYPLATGTACRVCILTLTVWSGLWNPDQVFLNCLAPAAMLCCGLCRHDPLCAGSTTAPSKSPSKTPAAALRRGFLGPAHRPDTRKVPAKQAVKQLPPAAEEEQPLAQVREWEAAAKPQKPEAPSAANSKRMSKFKQLRMVSE